MCGIVGQWIDGLASLEFWVLWVFVVVVVVVVVTVTSA